MKVSKNVVCEIVWLNNGERVRIGGEMEYLKMWQKAECNEEGFIQIIFGVKGSDEKVVVDEVNTGTLGSQKSGITGNDMIVKSDLKSCSRFTSASSFTGGMSRRLDIEFECIAQTSTCTVILSNNYGDDAEVTPIINGRRVLPVEIHANDKLIEPVENEDDLDFPDNISEPNDEEWQRSES